MPAPSSIRRSASPSWRCGRTGPWSARIWGEPALLELNPIVGLHPPGSVLPVLARQAVIIDQALYRLNNRGNGGGHHES
jgi:hypothetical protein